MPTPQLTDPAALSRTRARMRPESLFLHEDAADEIEARLGMVNRAFMAPVLTGPWPEFWTRRLALPNLVTLPEAEVLDVAPGTHDLAIHAMALHWASDPVGQIIQLRRALKPDGFFLACLFGGRTLSELRDALTRAEAEVTGGLSPRVAPMAEIRDLGALLQRSGLALPVADSIRLTVDHASPFHLMRELRHMGEGNALSDRLRHPTRRAVLTRAAEIMTAEHATPDGRVRSTFEIVFLTGWAPDGSQPQPLRPGSARARLAEALGTSETPLKP